MEYSFKKGFAQLSTKEASEVRAKIMSSLGLNSRASWYIRLNGNVEPKISEVNVIEAIFKEYNIAELLAWGASKKQVSEKLYISEKTVDNHTRRIYYKTGCNKVNELSAWWFCNEFHIPVTLSPFAKKLFASILLAIYLGSIPAVDGHLRPRARLLICATRIARSRTRELQLQIS